MFALLTLWGLMLLTTSRTQIHAHIDTWAPGNPLQATRDQKAVGDRQAGTGWWLVGEQGGNGKRRQVAAKQNPRQQVTSQVVVLTYKLPEHPPFGLLTGCGQLIPKLRCPLCPMTRFTIMVVINFYAVMKLSSTISPIFKRSYLPVFTSSIQLLYARGIPDRGLCRLCVTCTRDSSRCCRVVNNSGTILVISTETP